MSGECPFFIYERRIQAAYQPLCDSYDLDQDTRLAEETTVLVETYTVRISLPQAYSSNHSPPAPATGRPSNQDRSRTIRSTRMHVPTPPSRRRTARRSRNALPNHSISRRRSPGRTLQTYRPVWWFEYVSRLAKSTGERDEAALFDEGVER